MYMVNAQFLCFIYFFLLIFDSKYLILKTFKNVLIKATKYYETYKIKKIENK